VVIINQTMARRFFADEDPLGKTIGDRDLSPASLEQIVGVVSDVREGGLELEIKPAMYHPYKQDITQGFFVAVRTAQDPASMIPVIEAEIHHVDPKIGVRNQFTLAQHIDNASTAFLHRSSATLAVGFAAMALLLGVIGLYGVIAYSVSRRTREIGVRMALGAQRSAVYRLILAEAGWVAALGIIAGLACSIAAGGLLRSFLFGVGAWDVPTLSMVATALGVCTLLASYLPARRAAGVNPIEALREE